MATTSDRDDRRVRRTRRQLREALIALILKKGWDSVSVLDVCETADVGRSTFYVHFADKEDLLVSGFDELHAALEGQRRYSTEPFAFAEPLLVHAAENHALFRAIAGRQSGQQVQWRFRDLLLTLVEADLQARELPKATRTHVAGFVAGGFLDLLMGWLEDPSGIAPEELAASFRRLALGVVRAAETRQ